MTEKERTPTVVLGFDALTTRYLDEFELPNFDSLRTSGIEARLESTFPPWTGSAWPSMYTGMGPSYHGVYSFFDFEGQTPVEADLITRNSVKAPGLWNYLSSLGIRSIVLNTPVTHPAERINGIIIPGYLAPEEAAGHPKGIRQELSAAIGENYRIYAEESDTTPSVEAFVHLIELRRRAAKWLLETNDWEFAIVQVQKTDTVFHRFNDRNAFERIYTAADGLVGTILDTVGENANIVVCSDHGIGPTSGYNVYVNEVLRRHDFLSVTSSGDTPTLAGHKDRLVDSATMKDTDEYSLSGTAFSIVETLLRYGGITVGDMYTIARKLGVDSILSDVLTDEMRTALNRNTDWHRSRAYCRNAAELGVRINLEGREQRGIVPKSEYENVRTQLIQVLSSLTTPDEESAFEFVARREEVYDGPFTETACDVMFMPNKMNNVVASNIIGRTFVPITDFNHKRMGVFIASGPDVNTAVELERLSLTDVAPIVMALLQCAVPKQMTGSVPHELVDTVVTSHTYPDIQFGATTSSQIADDRVGERLNDLGYL